MKMKGLMGAALASFLSMIGSAGAKSPGARLTTAQQLFAVLQKKLVTRQRRPSKVTRARADAPPVLANAARSYRVRYTNVLSRRKGRDQLFNEAARAFAGGNKTLGERLNSAAATYPW